MLTPLLILTFATFVAISVIAIIRFFVRRSGKQKLYENGVTIGENGIEYWGFLFAGIRKKPFCEIRSVQLLPYFKVVINAFFFRYGLSTRRSPFNPFGHIVIIRLKHPNPIEYLFFTPTNALAFVEQLKSCIERSSNSPP